METSGIITLLGFSNVIAWSVLCHIHNKRYALWLVERGYQGSRFAMLFWLAEFFGAVLGWLVKTLLVRPVLSLLKSTPVFLSWVIRLICPRKTASKSPA